MTDPDFTLADLDRILSFRGRLLDDLPLFAQACSDNHARSIFDWPTWMTNQGQRFTTIDGLADASLDDCRRVLTVLMSPPGDADLQPPCSDRGVLVGHRHGIHPPGSAPEGAW